MLEMLRAVDAVLEDIGAGEQPRVLVLNKADLLGAERREELFFQHPDGVLVSAVTGEGMEALAERIADEFERQLRSVELLLPYAEGGRLAELHDVAGDLEREDTPEGVRVRAKLPAGIVARFAQFATNGTGATPMSRAAVVAAVAAGLLSLHAAPPASGREGPVELGAAINDAGFAFGGDAYRDTFDANYGAATAESAMKMTALQPSQGQFEFGQADAIVDWARSRGKQVHGHVLVWCADEWNPSWVTGRSWTREELLAVMEEHIRTVVDHFEGRVATWDVVNEALDDAGARKDCVWQRAIGDDWVEQAFRFARTADPAVRLFYNEYAADFPNAKFEGLMGLVKTLPLDGVGLQQHTYGYAPYQYDVEDAIARLGALGLDVHLSELNVTTSQIGGDLARQAQAYRTIAAACQAQPACFRVTTWGFTDAYGWRPPSEKAMPFDVEYAPKPAWNALQRALGRAAGPEAPVPAPPSVSAGFSQGASRCRGPASTAPPSRCSTATLERRGGGRSPRGSRRRASICTSSARDVELPGAGRGRPVDGALGRRRGRPDAPARADRRTGRGVAARGHNRAPFRSRPAAARRERRERRGRARRDGLRRVRRAAGDRHRPGRERLAGGRGSGVDRRDRPAGGDDLSGGVRPGEPYARALDGE